jgi:hypothetical protein
MKGSEWMFFVFLDIAKSPPISMEFIFKVKDNWVILFKHFYFHGWS